MECLGVFRRVKFGIRLQRLRQSYLLTYYQKEWADHTKNNPWCSLPKNYSFTAYCVYNTHFYLIRTFICVFVRMLFYPVCPSVNIRAFGPCVSMRVSLSPVRWGFNLISQQRSAFSTPNQYQTSSTVHSEINLVPSILFHYIDPRLYS